MKLIVALFFTILGFCVVVGDDVGAPSVLYTIKDTNNTMCGQVNTSMIIEIQYVDKNNASQIAKVPVPADATILPIDDCASMTHTMTLAPFYSNWKLSLDFTSDKALINGDTDGKEWALEGITGYYDSRSVNASYFPGLATAIMGSFESNSSSYGIKSQLNYTYACQNAATEIKVDDTVTLDFVQIQAQPFGNKPSFDVLTTCKADQKTSDLVPIIVGASLAVLVIVVLIAYVIGRIRAKRQGYSSV